MTWVLAACRGASSLLCFSSATLVFECCGARKRRRRRPGRKGQAGRFRRRRKGEKTLRPVRIWRGRRDFALSFQ